MAGTVSTAVPIAMQDVPYRALNGWMALGIALLCFLVGGPTFLGGVGLALARGAGGSVFALLAVAAVLCGFVLLAGLLTVQPRQAAVLTLFGRYHGTIARDGFWWRNPLTAVAKVPLATEAQETKIITVNDLMGNPITIAAAAVWRVHDAARARFDVGNYREFVSLQAEAALRNIASTRPYDHEEAEDLGGEAGRGVSDVKKRLAEKATRVAALRADRDAIHADLIAELGERVAVAGVVVEDVRLTHLAYAPEIAGAMLKRQQAGAIIAARRQIVEGAVAIVRDTLARLERPEDGRPGIVLDEAGRAAMAQNMLIMIVGDREATPVVSVGTKP